MAYDLTDLLESVLRACIQFASVPAVTRVVTRTSATMHAETAVTAIQATLQG